MYFLFRNVYIIFTSACISYYINITPLYKPDKKYIKHRLYCRFTLSLNKLEKSYQTCAIPFVDFSHVFFSDFCTFSLHLPFSGFTVFSFLALRLPFSLVPARFLFHFDPKSVRFSHLSTIYIYFFYLLFMFVIIFSGSPENDENERESDYNFRFLLTFSVRVRIEGKIEFCT